ncbi:phosphatidylinositol mannoside acyltransferase [Rugosimonospora africana]|uniref:Phosphatidylinositol mannoside acyltransferase n=1 Tax=Rugosimonospora africana TaxID=556532 RepID=A0A8J3QZB4_9ACTN|nr:phosphatidylinositol mannoside acyltransferase [Rugosimonospora africana]GIH17376.1 phosphatidylinositol mannoside acyltransferase [Rugosimonospora africana]
MSRTADLGYAAGWRVLRVLPLGLTAPGFRAAADWTTWRRGRGVQRLAGNLRRVVGPEISDAELDTLVRHAARSYFRYALEAFRLPNSSHEQRLHGFQLDGVEKLAADMSSGRGAVVALAHSGNWDAAGAWAAAMGWPVITVAERLKPESLFRRFIEFREGLGMEILPLTGGQGSTVQTLEERLRRGYVVPILADRDLSRNGVEVTFFGAGTKVPPGPALLALRTGKPLYTLDMWFSPDATRGLLRGPLPLPGPEVGPMPTRVRRLAQDIADSLAKGIAAHPVDWHMMQRMWPDDAVMDAATTDGEAGR